MHPPLYIYIPLSSNNVMKNKTLLALTALRIYVTTCELSFRFPRTRKVFVSYGVIGIFLSMRWTSDARPVSTAASFWYHLRGIHFRYGLLIVYTIVPWRDRVSGSCGRFASRASKVVEMLFVAIKYCSCFFQCTSCATQSIVLVKHIGSHGWTYLSSQRWKKGWRLIQRLATHNIQYSNASQLKQWPKDSRTDWRRLWLLLQNSVKMQMSNWRKLSEKQCLP